VLVDGTQQPVSGDATFAQFTLLYVDEAD